MKRKPRSDRNHLIYVIRNSETGEEYIGLTVLRKGNIQESMRIRWNGHQYKAFVEEKGTPLCRAFRKYENQPIWEHEPLFVVRGKKGAHALEAEIIAERAPAYNKLLR